MQEHNHLAQINSNETNTPRLQPMSFTDILDGMFNLYRNHIRLFLGIVIVYFVLEFCIEIISGLLFRDESSVLSIDIVILSFTTFCSTVVSILVGAALAYVSAQIYLDRALTSGAAWQQARRRFWSYLGSGILWFLVVAGLFITVIGIPFAIYFMVRWGLYTLPVLFEETTARNALRRSTDLVKGTWWRVCGIMLAVSLISFMIIFILEISSGFLLSWGGIAEPETPSGVFEAIREIFMPTPSDIGWIHYAIRRLVSLSIVAFTMPIAPIGMTLLYFDLRIRKEAYDIEAQVTN